ncbi:uncharacterized protein LOC128610642 [Ictalurus furcatus]|uniref:uncharacterized protein LOC128610642 n=1 Tax=Ictalurus furcatus TaxID=66913 RepID=UPI0023506242|nr:uncharacterized protein LOC128610642 [Ictalurus furcatus]
MGIGRPAAGTSDWERVILEQNRALAVYRDEISALRAEVSRLSVSASTNATPPALASPPLTSPAHVQPTPAAHIPAPAVHTRCKGFMLQCALFFESHPEMPEVRKLTHFMESLSGTALAWATAEWERGGGVRPSLDDFLARFQRPFDHSPDSWETGDELMQLKQGSCTAREYALEFRTIAARSGWNEPALKTAFRRGLDPELLHELACRGEQLTFDDLVDLTIRLDRLRRTNRPIPHGLLPAEPGAASEPMQLGGARSREEERERRSDEFRCFYCGEDTHVVRQCPHRRRRGNGRRTDNPPCHARVSPNQSSLIDSGAAENFIDEKTTPELGLSIRPLLRPRAPRSLWPLTVESPLSPASVKIPPEYHDLHEVFSKERASCLPPHRPYDCAIDLLPGASLPWGRVYPLSQAEQQAMEEYIQEALRQGYIRPSTSPMSAGFFFVEKKGGGLRPCIDYWALNQVTVKYRYLLPLVASALEQLRSATLFTKLDLRSAYNLIRIREGDEWKTAFSTTSGHYEYLVMPYGLTNAPSVFQNLINDALRDMLGRYVIAYIDDILIYSTSLEEHVQHVRHVLQRLLQYQLYVKAEKCEFHQHTISFLGYVISPRGVAMDQRKIQAVVEWPTPRTVRELQRFLGFANFYRRFIRDFSKVAQPLTSLLRGKPRRLLWTPVAQEALERLKRAFTTAPHSGRRPA